MGRTRKLYPRVLGSALETFRPWLVGLVSLERFGEKLMIVYASLFLGRENFVD